MLQHRRALLSRGLFCSGAEPSEKAGGIAAEGEDDLPILSIVVIDGTWNNVKQLLRHSA